MKITVGDRFSKVHTNVPKRLGMVRELCRARPDGFQYMPKYRSGRWDGYISVMRGFSEFPTGLLHRIHVMLEENDIEYSLERVDEEFKDYKPISKDIIHGVTLRDYQVLAVNDLLLATRGVAKMATNSGKTEVFAAIISKLQPYRAAVVVHRKELMYQTRDRLAERLQTSEIGMIGDGIEDSSHPITVAMVQTLSSRGEHYISETFADNNVLVVDECHHTSSDQMMDVLFNIPGWYRYGFSGTPLRYDKLADMKLIGMTGPVVVDVTNEDLIENGFSAKPIIHVYTISNDGHWDADYHDAYDEMIVNNDERNKLLASAASDFQSNGSVVMILVTRIDHGESLSRMIPGSVFVHGSCTTEYRQEVLGKMRQGIGNVYIASPIFDEGIDVPSVDALILAGGGKSHIKLLQRVGRGLRKKEGDNMLHVVDFIDDTNEYLLNHSEERIKTYEAEGFEVRLAN